MRLLKEARIGLLAAISLVIFFVGYYFLKGASLFSKNKDYYCYYSNVEGMQNSANVQIQGLNVGHISSMQLVPGKGVRVNMTINKDIVVPVGSVASLEAADLLGTKMVHLILGPGPGLLPTGSELLPAREGGVMDNVTAKLTPRLHELKGTIRAFDTTLAGVNAMVNTKNQQEIAEALHSIRVSANNLELLTAALKTETGEISSILKSSNSFAKNLASNNDTINRILANASSVSRQLSNAPIEKTLADLQATSKEFRGIAEKVNSSQGTLGLLINNKDVYNNLNSSIRSLDSLEKDIKAHPGRYINVSVFGKKQK
jgi:phospholipid/cholesterol/gamma-HCH transport system substrate-binding protein